MKTYTKKGDSGQTSLLGGKRVSKDDLRVEAYGTIDELNSNIGELASIMSESKDQRKIKELEKIQSTLFLIGSYLADKEGKFISLKKLKAKTEGLEKQIDVWEKELPKLTSFILPGGTPAAAKTHVIRTVTRRAERQVVKLDSQKKIDENVLKYLNRLSDYFFVLARWLNFKAVVGDKIWKP